MGRRGRRQERAEKLAAPDSNYTDADGNVLTLRGSLTPGARLEYAQALAGAPGQPGGHAGGRLEARRRAAVQAPDGALDDRRSADRAPARAAREVPRGFGGGARVGAGALREHCAEWFPDVQAP